MLSIGKTLKVRMNRLNFNRLDVSSTRQLLDSSSLASFEIILKDAIGNKLISMYKENRPGKIVINLLIFHTWFILSFLSFGFELLSLMLHDASSMGDAKVTHYYFSATSSLDSFPIFEDLE